MATINTRDLPEWMNNFIATFSKNEKKVESSTEKEAEVNVKDLPKVVWNDETFYAMFDNGNATVLNEFGNTVTTIKGASTIEAVDQHLNGKQVVTSAKEEINNVLEEELNKVSAYLAVEADNQPVQPGQPQQAPQDEFGAPEQTEQQPNSNPDQTSQEVDNLENDVNSTTANLDVVAKMAAMEDQVQTLTKQVTALTEQLRGYQDPGAVYDLNVVPAEQQHFEESAQQSAQEIEREHNTDLTTMQGRVSLVDKIMEDIDTIMDTEELNVNEQELNDLNNIEQTEIEEPISEEELVELDIPDMEETKEPEEDKEISEEDVKVDEEPEIDPTDVEVVEEPANTDKDDKKEDKDDKKEDDKEDKTDEEIIKLNSRDSKIFKERICPSCGEKMLTLSNKVAHMQGVYCKVCKAEYGVDTNTESIYKKA